MASTHIELREQVREHYAKAAEGSGCCAEGWGCGGLEVIQSARRVGPTGRPTGST